MSGKTGIVVQARMSSTRLPGKSLLEIGVAPLLFYVVQRLKLTGLPVVVCTSTHSSDDILCKYLDVQGWSYHRAQLKNVLQRYIETAEAFEMDQIVRVTGDNPFVDIDYLQDSLPLFEHYDYVDGIYPQGLLKGSGFEFVRLSELKSIPSAEAHHQEHVTNWLRENTEDSRKRIRLQPNKINKHRNDISLTCDFEEDLILIRKILNHFNYRVDVPLAEIIGLLEDNPQLKEINKQLHFPGNT